MPSLSDLIDLPEHPLVSLVGAGGKTTTMYTLARELAQKGKRVITTTTTQIFTPTPDETEQLIIEAETSSLLRKVKAAWEHHRCITLATSINERGKLMGLSPDIPMRLMQEGGADAVIIEADGARHRMIKAPADYEPVVPRETNVALLLISAGAINQPLSEEVAHRPERITEVTGINPGDTLTPAIIARLMTSERGALKGIPETASAYVLITHVTLEQREAARELAHLAGNSPCIAGTLFSEEASAWFSA